MINPVKPSKRNMPLYNYTAITPSGKPSKGQCEANGAAAAREQLRLDNLMVTSLEVNTPTDTANTSYFWQRLRSRAINPYDLALFTRQLSVLLSSAIPLDEALLSISRQSEKKSLALSIQQVRERLLAGYSFADALGYVGGFPGLYVATIKSGERSGKLDEILLQLAGHTEERYAMQQQVKTAIRYPLFLAIVAFATVMGLMTFIVPKILDSVVEAGQTLPLLTVMVKAVSDFCIAYWYVLLGAGVMGVAFVRKLLATDSGKAVWHGFLLRFPLSRRLTQGVNAAKVASTLSILTRSGVPLVEAVQISAEVVDNVWIKQTLRLTAQKVMEGGSLSYQIEKSKQFPAMMVQMIKSGEHSGELENMLQKASQMQSNEVRNIVSALLALLEPLMILLMAVVVLIIMLAVMLPIISMNDVL